MIDRWTRWVKASAAIVAAAGVAAGTMLLSSPAARAGRLVADTGKLSTADEQKALNVPPGFEVQLVASEPEIHKPIEINFDDRGRLWVTSTVEYPFPAKEGAKTGDALIVLDDFADDGHARKATTFADNLNIPVGVLPHGDNSAIVYSIPNIWKVTDTTGSGHADRREVLMGKIETLDTHGMTGSFTESFDGWVYAVHGFRNTSTLTAKDGSSITMNSGNTYRFKPDGSHIEQWTHGQVNPHGLCIDSAGNIFTSDCETKPIALMMRESYHPSFGKPDDGLGFEPEMCDHMYGSTAIAGLCDYVADQFPQSFRNRMFVGNVVTNRINAAQVTPVGSGFHGDDSPDFITTADEWFRPVCIKLGPDGAIYVADFYNKIIGHYEVDLHHPGRDRTSGRIWRIVYKGKDAAPLRTHFDLTKETPEQLVNELADANLTVRMLAMNRLADFVGQPAIAPLKEAFAKPKNAPQKVHAMWDLQRLGALEPDDVKSAASDSEPLVRQHAMRVLGEIHTWNRGERALAIAGLKDADPTTCRLAAEALARHPDFANIRPLLSLRHDPKSDPWLVYGARIALRDQLQLPGIRDHLLSMGLNNQDKADLADVAVATTGPETAGFLLDYVRSENLDRASLARYLGMITKSVPIDQADDLARLVESKFGDDLDVQLASITAVLEGLQQRGSAPSDAVRSWGRNLAQSVFGKANGKDAAWTFHPVPGSHDSRNPWAVQQRKSADGIKDATFLSSNVFGETLTGVVRSPAFTIPPKLSFYLAGQDSPPNKPAGGKNYVRLCDAKTGEVLVQQGTPRNDTAQLIAWDLTKFVGREGYFEATDGDKATAWAWMAFGRFQPAVVHISDATMHLGKTVRIVQDLHLNELAGAVENLLTSDGTEPDSRVAAAQALGKLGAAQHETALAAVVGDQAAPEDVRRAAADALGPVGSKESFSSLVGAITTAPERLQLNLAKALAATPAGAEALLDAVQNGKASARLLQDPTLRERLTLAKPADLDARLAALTKGLPAADSAIQKLIDERAASFDPNKASKVKGRAVFEKNCMVCHMVAGKGSHVGPQLDGIGIRGVARLAEDVLDPSRNVDAAFRYSTFVLTDGNILDGIPRHEEGQTLTIADATGKETTIDKSKIKRRHESKLSLMPSNFGEIIPEKDFHDLMSYLLSTAQK